mmetsp:Transcript_25336/g.59343  ORF Transcript_25336/g.59343 Transcript_25336/m.59343 type:complete len:213 (-) Transcript_25336:540-1178(-)
MIQGCAAFYSTAENGRACLLSESSNATIASVRGLLHQWSSKDVCGHDTGKKGDTDWKHVDTTFRVGHQRLLYLFSRVAKELGLDSHTTKDTLKLVQEANHTYFHTRGQVPLFVLHGPIGSHGGDASQVLIGLPPDQPITRSKVYFAKDCFASLRCVAFSLILPRSVWSATTRSVWTNQCLLAVLPWLSFRRSSSFGASTTNTKPRRSVSGNL